MHKFIPSRKKAKGNEGKAAPANSKTLILAKAEYKKAVHSVVAVKLTITMKQAAVCQITL